MEERGIISKYGDFGGGVWGGLEEIHVFGGVQVPVLHNRPGVSPNHPMGGRGGMVVVGGGCGMDPPPPSIPMGPQCPPKEPPSQLDGGLGEDEGGLKGGLGALKGITGGGWGGLMGIWGC